MKHSTYDRLLCTTGFPDGPRLFTQAAKRVVMHVVGVRAPAQMAWIDANRIVATVQGMMAASGWFTVCAFTHQIARGTSISSAVTVDGTPERPHQAVLAGISDCLLDERRMRTVRSETGFQGIAVTPITVTMHLAEAFGVMRAVAVGYVTCLSHTRGYSTGAVPCK